MMNKSQPEAEKVDDIIFNCSGGDSGIVFPEGCHVEIICESCGMRTDIDMGNAGVQKIKCHCGKTSTYSIG